MAETVYEKLLAWDAAGAADLLAKDPELWGQAPAARRLSVHFRKDVAWMLGDVAATPLSVAVRLTRKEDRKQGTDMVRALLEVFKNQPENYWKRPLFPAVTTPLHEAMFFGLGEIAVLLIQAGFRPDTPNKLNFTSMDMAEDPSMGQKIVSFWKGKSDAPIFDEADDDTATESENLSHGFRSTSSISMMEREGSSLSLPFSIAESVHVDGEAAIGPETEPTQDSPGNELDPGSAAVTHVFISDNGVVTAKHGIVPLPAVEHSEIGRPISEPSGSASEENLANQAVSSIATQSAVTEMPITPTKLSHLSRESTPVSSPTKSSIKSNGNSPDKGMALFGKRKEASNSWAGAGRPSESGTTSAERSPERSTPKPASTSPGGDRGLSLFAARRKHVEDAAAAEKARYSNSAVTASATVNSVLAETSPVVAKDDQNLDYEPTPTTAVNKRVTLSGQIADQLLPVVEKPTVLEHTAVESGSDWSSTPTTAINTMVFDHNTTIVKVSGGMAYLGESQPDFVAPDQVEVLKGGPLQEKQDSALEVEGFANAESESTVSMDGEAALPPYSLANQLPPRLPSFTAKKQISTPKIDTSHRVLREVAASNSSLSSLSPVRTPTALLPFSPVEGGGSVLGHLPGVPPNTPTIDLPMSPSDALFQADDLAFMMQYLPMLSESSSLGPTPTSASATSSLPPLCNVPPNTPTTLVAPPTSSTIPASYHTPPNTPTVVIHPLTQPVQSGLLGGILSALDQFDTTPGAELATSAASDPIPAPLQLETESAAMPQKMVAIPQLAETRLTLNYDDLLLASNALQALSQEFPEGGAMSVIEPDVEEKVIKYMAKHPDDVKAELEAQKKKAQEEAKKAELIKLIQSGSGFFVGRIMSCELQPGLPDSACPVDLWIGVSGTNGEFETERVLLSGGPEQRIVDLSQQNPQGFSLYLQGLSAADITIYFAAGNGRKMEALSSEAFQAELLKQATPAPPPLPPRRDSVMQRQLSGASIHRGPAMTHSVSLASSLGAAQSVAGTESTFLTSRQSNFSSASLADSFTLREHGSGGVAVMRSQLLDDSWQDAPYQICEGQLGPVLINLQMDVPTTIHESQGGSSSSPPRAQQQTAAKESGRKGLLKRLGSVVSRKGGLAPPTTSSVSAFARSPTGATTASISTTRRVLAATQATVFFQGFWIPGDCAEGPRDLEDAGRWLSRIARYEEEINTGDALVLSDGSTVVVPEWAATFSKMLMFGLV